MIKKIILNFPIICLFFSILNISLTEGILKHRIEKQLLRWLVGVVYMWAGLSHLLIPKISAKSIGWKESPFQIEVGAYDFILGLTAFLASFNKFKILKPGVIVIFCFFSFIAGINHLYQKIKFKNNSKNNSGFILWMDIFLPIIFIYLFYDRN